MRDKVAWKLCLSCRLLACCFFGPFIQWLTGIARSISPPTRAGKPSSGFATLMSLVILLCLVAWAQSLPLLLEVQMLTILSQKQCFKLLKDYGSQLSLWHLSRSKKETRKRSSAQHLNKSATPSPKLTLQSIETHFVENLAVQMNLKSSHFSVRGVNFQNANKKVRERGNKKLSWRLEPRLNIKADPPLLKSHDTRKSPMDLYSQIDLVGKLLNIYQQSCTVEVQFFQNTTHINLRSSLGGLLSNKSNE